MVTAAEALLAHLVGLGVSFVIEENRLRAQAPKGVLAPALRADIARYKPDLMTLINAGADLPEKTWLSEMRRAMAPALYDVLRGCEAASACSRLGPCVRHQDEYTCHLRHSATESTEKTPRSVGVNAKQRRSSDHYERDIDGQAGQA